MTNTDKPSPVAEPASEPPHRLDSWASECSEPATDNDHLPVAPASAADGLPEPVAFFGRMDEAEPATKLYSADQMHAAIAAERARTADTHAAYCHSQQQFHDAVAELSTLRQQLAEAVRERNPWRMAIDDALVTAHLGVATDDPYDDLNRLLDWHYDIWLDPAVCSDAQALIDRGAAASEAELSTLRQQLAEAGRDAERMQFMEKDVYMLDAVSDPDSLVQVWVGPKQRLSTGRTVRAAIDAAIAAQGEAKPPDVERELFEGE